jgi:hypothetical protein
MTIKKREWLLNFMMFCLGATVGCQIGDPYEMRHLAAKSADSMLMNIPHYKTSGKKVKIRLANNIHLNKPDCPSGHPDLFAPLTIFNSRFMARIKRERERERERDRDRDREREREERERGRRRRSICVRLYCCMLVCPRDLGRSITHT